MNSQLQRLIELQNTDSEITELERGKAAIPKQIESGKSDLKEKQEELKQAEGVLAELQKKRKELEMEVATENDHIAKTKSKLPAVKTNKEYTAILTEVDAVKEKISVLEDKELELMEELEEKEKGIPAFKAECKEEEENFNAYKAKKEAETMRTEEELEVLRVRRHAAAGGIEEKLLGQYNKVFKARDSLAVVTIKENICQGCHSQILPQQVIDVKKGESINQCEQCSRILYWEETSETAVPK